MLDQMTEVFFEEANELLDNLEGQLLTLEEDPTNADVISAVFRAMHTIKGSAGMFGFDAVSKFTHKIENVYDMVRGGQLTVDKELISLTLTARDHIRDLLTSTDTASMQDDSQKILANFDDFVKKHAPAQENPEDIIVKEAPKTEKEPEEENTWRIKFRPSRSIMLNGTRPDLLLNELRDMGKTTIVSYFQDIPPLSSMDCDKCYIYWDIILTTTKKKNDIEDVFIFLGADDKIEVEKIDMTVAEHKKLGEILVDRHSISQEQLEEILNKQKKIGEVLVEKKITTKTEVKAALAEQTHIKKVAQNQDTLQTTSQTIRVNSEKLDQLIDLVGEMVTFNARLGQLATEINVPALVALGEQSGRLINSLRDTAMDMRMLPIGTIFSKFRRLVRDLANSLGKNIELMSEGAETELDKTVIEKLNDPLVHLIRNSADHGIELPEVRKAAGKNEQGIITLTAKHTGAFVLISITDDGAGLNKEKIINKAVEKGIIKAGETLTDNEIHELIFKPGFSTATTVTDVSGRGVGMDVVKRDISSLGGTVMVESEEGKGSSFILKIPLTLAIIEGILVEIAGCKYVIPLANINECIEFELAKGKSENPDSICTHITARGNFIPCIYMRRYFNIKEEEPKSQKVAIVNDQNQKVGIIVDKVIGNHQTVIKSLGKLYKDASAISGGTILGDGTVALILDIFKLIQIVNQKEQDTK